MTPLDPGMGSQGIYIGDIPFMTLGRPKDGYNLFGLKGESTDDFGLVYPGTYADWPQSYAGKGAALQNAVGGISLLLLALGALGSNQSGGWHLPWWVGGLGLLGLLITFVLYLTRPKEQRQFEAAQKQRQAHAALVSTMTTGTLTLRLDVGPGPHPKDTGTPYQITRRRGDQPVRVEELPLPPSRRVYVTLVGLTPDEKQLLEKTVSRTLSRNSG